MYAGQVERFQRLFGKERVHVLLHERFKRDPAGTMRQVFAAIGVEPVQDLDVSGKFNEAAVPRHALLNRLLVRSGAISAVKAMVPRELRGGFKKMLYSKEDMPVLPKEQAERLWKTYEPDVDRLSALIDTDLRQWWGTKQEQA
jgi:hypothetical protein